MPRGSIEISFRVWLPSASFRWTDKEPEGWISMGGPLGTPELPWLLRDLDPDATASSDGAHLVDRSGTGLYRDFLRLAKHSLGTKEVFGDAVVAFANHYGFLGEPFELCCRLTENVEILQSAGQEIRLVDPAALPARGVDAESLQTWRKEVQSFYEFDDIANLLRTGDIDGLRRRIEVDSENKEIRYVNKGRFRQAYKPIATLARHPIKYERLQRSQAFDRAWTYLTGELDKRLKTSLFVQVPSDPRRRAVAHPTTLLDALYLCLYLKAANIGWESDCLECNTPLPPERRTSRKFCDANCRLKYHRRNRVIERAQAMENV